MSIVQFSAKVSKVDLSKALKDALAVIPKKPILSMLSCVSLETINDALKISVANLDVAYVATIDAEIITPISEPFLLDLSTLSAIVNTSSDRLLLTIEDYTLTVNSEHGSAKLTVRSEEFVDIYAFVKNPIHAITASNETFLKAIDSVGFAMSDDRSRLSLNATRFVARGSLLKCVATDGHLLSEQNLEYVKMSLEDNVGFSIPSDVVKLLKKSLDKKGTLQISGDERHIVIKSSNFEYIVLVENYLPYPKYKSVIPVSFERSTSVDRKNFIEILKQVLPICNKKTQQIRIDLASNSLVLKISAKNDTTGNNIERNFSPKSINNSFDFAIGFNCGYLLEILGKMKAETVHLNFNSSIGACVIRANDHENYFLLMPLRLVMD